MDITLLEIENTLKEIFTTENGLVKSVDSVYEKMDGGYKLVISIHNISMGDTIIAHTKFIFKTNEEKSIITENEFIYLYDINCVYRKVNFEATTDLESKVTDIIKDNKFGADIKAISKFITAPAMLLNFYFERENITEFSVYEASYDPKFNIKPCAETTFDFDINLNNKYDINLSISKHSNEGNNKYKFRFSLMDKHKTIETNQLQDIHLTIGEGIVEILQSLEQVEENKINKILKYIKLYENFVSKNININNVILDKEIILVNPRNYNEIISAHRENKIPLDKNRVRAMMNTIQSGKQLPPIELDKNSKLINGYHRYAAYKAMNINQIPYILFHPPKY